MISECKGRKLLVMFTCGRCGKTHIEPYKNQVHKMEGNLQCFLPPEGWRNNTISLPLLCDVCSKAFDDFMKAGSAKKKSCDNCAKKRFLPTDMVTVKSVCKLGIRTDLNPIRVTGKKRRKSDGN